MKKQLKIDEANRIREIIANAVDNTGLQINDDDTEAEKKKKQKKMQEMLGLDTTEMKGTNAGKKKPKKINRYGAMNVLRFARYMDNYKDGEMVNELYNKENECYTKRERAIQERTRKISEVMKTLDITPEKLSEVKEIKYGRATIHLTVDELLYFLKANEDEQSRNAVMYGNVGSIPEIQAKMSEYLRLDAETTDAEELLLGCKKGTHAFMEQCKNIYDVIINEADGLDENFKKFSDAIAKDYGEQYDKMNEASIEEFNSPVMRVEHYVPLVRLESSGDTNVNRVKEDLLATMNTGTSGKQWTDKGMTKKRIDIGALYQKPVETGLYKTWTDSVQRTEHFIAYAPYVRELNRIFKSRDSSTLRQGINRRYSKDAVDYLDSYINEVANPNAAGAQNQLDRIMKVLRGKTAPAYLAWKMSSIIKQAATSPWPFMQQ